MALGTEVDVQYIIIVITHRIINDTNYYYDGISKYIYIYIYIYTHMPEFWRKVQRTIDCIEENPRRGRHALGQDQRALLPLGRAPPGAAEPRSGRGRVK